MNVRVQTRQLNIYLVHFVYLNMVSAPLPFKLMCTILTSTACILVCCYCTSFQRNRWLLWFLHYLSAAEMFRDKTWASDDFYLPGWLFSSINIDFVRHRINWRLWPEFEGIEFCQCQVITSGLYVESLKLKLVFLLLFLLLAL